MIYNKCKLCQNILQETPFETLECENCNCYRLLFDDDIFVDEYICLRQNNEYFEIYNYITKKNFICQFSYPGKTKHFEVVKIDNVYIDDIDKLKTYLLFI